MIMVSTIGTTVQDSTVVHLYETRFFKKSFIDSVRKFIILFTIFYYITLFAGVWTLLDHECLGVTGGTTVVTVTVMELDQLRAG